ncbi:MAG: HDOD domain-containing protein [Planctomycetota bacterium]|nr:MAG: HDOD domain-containing protein [Planctomycetota bacterium]
MLFRLIRKKRADPQQALRKVLGEYRLPSFRGVILQALERLRDPTTTATEVADVISADPGLSVKVLATVNSAAFSARRPVDDLAQAVALLGTSRLESIILSLAVAQALPAPRSSAFEAASFWSLAAKRAVAARSLARYLHRAQAAEAFTQALLQDLAVPLLVAHGPTDYDLVLAAWRAGEGPLQELERGRYGWDHAEVGGWVCDAWKLPARLGAAVAGHHAQPPPPECLPAAALVARLGPDAPGVPPDFVVAAEALGVAADRAEAAIAESADEAARLASLFA